MEALYPAQTEAEVKPSMDRLVTQMGFGASARFTAECMDKMGEPAYLYLFTQAPSDPRTQGLGTFHGLEIMYVFGNLDKVAMEGVGEADYALSEAMMDYWTGFAKGRRPQRRGGIRAVAGLHGGHGGIPGAGGDHHHRMPTYSSRPTTW